jgi:hypothetical protein
MAWASEMTTDAIKVELVKLHADIVDFESDEDFEGHGGSPREGMYERWEELTLELKKRRVEHPFGQ